MYISRAIVQPNLGSVGIHLLVTLLLLSFSLVVAAVAIVATVATTVTIVASMFVLRLNRWSRELA